MGDSFEGLGYFRVKSIAVILQDGTTYQTLGNRVAQIRIGHGNEQRGFLTPQLPIAKFDSGLGLFF